MLFSKPRIFNKKIQLNQSFFSRSRAREKESDDAFNNASSGFTSFQKIVVQLFFTPIVAATSILLPSLLLLIANVCVALGYLVDFGYSLQRREVSNLDTFLTILGLIVAIALSIYISPIMLSSSMTFLLAWVAASQIATAINVAFIVGKFINPPLKRLIEWVASCFGFDIKELYCKKIPLNVKDDQFIIDHLLNGPLTPQNQKKLDTHNRLLNMLCQYSSKYQEQMFGNVFLEKKIKKMKEYIDNLTMEGKVEGLIFIKRKISYKLTKIAMLTKAMGELDAALDEKKGEAFQGVGLGFFDAAALPKTYREAYHLLLKEKLRQESKALELIKCLPDELDVREKLDRLKIANGLEKESCDSMVGWTGSI